MKTTLLFIGLVALIFPVKAQTARFFINGSATSSVTGDCSSLKQMKVSFPVPANVATYDEYYINLQLSSLDVPAYLYFSKEDIAVYLKGKKEYVAEIITADLASDFTFDDNALSMKDICFLPRVWKMPEVKIDVQGVGYKITGYHFEAVWNEQKNAWIETKIPDWDNGTIYGTGSIAVKQQPLSDGISDINGVINVKPQGEKVSFGEPDAAEALGTLLITDESSGYPVEYTFAYYDADTLTKEMIENELLFAIGGKESSSLFGAYMDIFSYLRDLKHDSREPWKGNKQDKFSPVTISGVSYDKIVYRQKWSFESSTYTNKLVPGNFIQFYVAQCGTYVVVVQVKATDVLSEDYESVSFSQPEKELNPEWFSKVLSESDMNEIDQKASGILQTAKYNTVK